MCLAVLQRHKNSDRNFVFTGHSEYEYEYDNVRLDKHSSFLQIVNWSHVSWISVVGYLKIPNLSVAQCTSATSSGLLALATPANVRTDMRI